MEKNILTELEAAMQRRHIKIPALSIKLGIPKDRMYKWYQEGTKPKEKDATTIWKWINGENEEGQENLTGESQAPYGNMANMIDIIQSHLKLLLEQQKTIYDQQATIHYLTTGGNRNNGKKISG